MFWIRFILAIILLIPSLLTLANDFEWTTLKSNDGICMGQIEQLEIIDELKVMHDKYCFALQKLGNTKWQQFLLDDISFEINQINDLDIDRGKVHLATNAGIFTMNNIGVWHKIPEHSRASNALPSLIISKIVVDQGIIYAVTSKGLSISKDTGLTWQTYGQSSGLPSNKIYDVYIYQEKIYILTSGVLSVSSKDNILWTNHLLPIGYQPVKLAFNNDYVVGVSQEGVIVSSIIDFNWRINDLSRQVVNDVIAYEEGFILIADDMIAITHKAISLYWQEYTISNLPQGNLRRVAAVGSASFLVGSLYGVSETVVNMNIAPTAIIDVDKTIKKVGDYYAVNSNNNITLDARRSHVSQNSNLEKLSYYWESEILTSVNTINDSEVTMKAPSYRLPQKGAADPNIYKVRLTVTDELGRSDSVEILIRVLGFEHKELYLSNKKPLLEDRMITGLQQHLTNFDKQYAGLVLGDPNNGWSSLLPYGSCQTGLGQSISIEIDFIHTETKRVYPLTLKSHIVRHFDRFASMIEPFNCIKLDEPFIVTELSAGIWVEEDVYNPLPIGRYTATVNAQLQEWETLKPLKNYLFNLIYQK